MLLAFLTLSRYQGTGQCQRINLPLLFPFFLLLGCANITRLLQGVPLHTYRPPSVISARPSGFEPENSTHADKTGARLFEGSGTATKNIPRGRLGFLSWRSWWYMHAQAYMVFLWVEVKKPSRSIHS